MNIIIELDIEKAKFLRKTLGDMLCEKSVLVTRDSGDGHMEFLAAEEESLSFENLIPVIDQLSSGINDFELTNQC